MRDLTVTGVQTCALPIHHAEELTIDAYRLTERVGSRRREKIIHDRLANHCHRLRRRFVIRAVPSPPGQLPTLDTLVGRIDPLHTRTPVLAAEDELCAAA